MALFLFNFIFKAKWATRKKCDGHFYSKDHLRNLAQGGGGGDN